MKHPWNNLESYNYKLPEELIAATQATGRHFSRLMVINRNKSRREHRYFYELPALLNKNDLLVFNDTETIPARVIVYKPTGGKVEILIIGPLAPHSWNTSPKSGNINIKAMIKNPKSIEAGTYLHIYDSIRSRIRVKSWIDNRTAELEVETNVSLFNWLSKVGTPPLPPYVLQARKRLNLEKYLSSDKDNYQSIWAKHKGSIAAPTASLHFTPQLLRHLKQKGVEHTFITLHVGLGTFLPIRTQLLTEHIMHSEPYTIPSDLKPKLETTKANGGRIIAVGTTVARALETEYRNENSFSPGNKETALFLHPGNPISFIDAMITNFHTPKSTLMALVSSYIGIEKLHAAYADAICKKYRFYSYGDAMLLV